MSHPGTRTHFAFCAHCTCTGPGSPNNRAVVERETIINEESPEDAVRPLYLHSHMKEARSPFVLKSWSSLPAGGIFSVLRAGAQEVPLPPVGAAHAQMTLAKRSKNPSPQTRMLTGASHQSGGMTARLECKENSEEEEDKKKKIIAAPMLA
eukprot:scaffold109867_cov14-Tisochrysis_lutea.AAC.1